MDTVGLLTYAQMCYVTNNLPLLLSSTTLNSNAASVSYVLAGQYNRLMVCWSATSTAAVASTTLTVTCNGDTASHYLSAIMENSSGTVNGAFAGLTTGMQAATIGGANDTTNYWSSGTFFLNDVNQSGHTPTMVGIGTQFTEFTPSELGHMGVYSGQYVSTALITSVTLAPGTGSFAAESVFSFYGLS